MEYLQLQWDDVEGHVERLVADIRASGRVYDRVIAVSRGGLIPAALVAMQLGVKSVESIQVRLYDGSTCLGVPQIVGPQPASAGPSGEPGRSLIVDEIVDSGATLDALAKLFPDAQRAALVGRVPREEAAHSCEEDPSLLIGASIATECWVVFPWSPAEDRSVARS